MGWHTRYLIHTHSYSYLYFILRYKRRYFSSKKCNTKQFFKLWIKLSWSGCSSCICITNSNNTKIFLWQHYIHIVSVESFYSLGTNSQTFADFTGQLKNKFKGTYINCMPSTGIALLDTSELYAKYRYSTIGHLPVVCQVQV